MKTRALKTFRGRYGLIRAGNVFECEPGYYKQLAKMGMVQKEPERTLDEPGQPPDPNKPDNPGPSKDRDAKGPPFPPGKSPPGVARKPPGDTARRTGGGQALTSRSLRADLRSRGKTSKKSDGGELETAATLAAASHVLGTESGGETGGGDAIGGE